MLKCEISNKYPFYRLGIITHFVNCVNYIVINICDISDVSFEVGFLLQKSAECCDSSPAVQNDKSGVRFQELGSGAVG